MATEYVMRAFHTGLGEHVYWFSLNSADLAGTYSGYDPSLLTSIGVDYTVNVPDAIGQGNLNLLTGAAGPAGPNYTLATANATIGSNKVVYLINGKIEQHTGSTSVPMFGFLATGLSSSASGNVIIAGPLSGFSLGDGYVCAVGVTSTGTPIRVADPTCVSAPNYLGYCDAKGNVFVRPRKADNFNVLDFGALGDGVSDDTNAIMTMVRATKAASSIDSKFAGISLYFPKGVYLCSQQINFDAFADDITHDWPNTTIYGDGNGLTGNGNRGSSTLIYTATGTTPFISARSTSQFTMRSISVLYQSGSFTGTLIDCGGYAAGFFETTSPTFIDVNMGCDAAAYSTAAAMLSLDACLDSVVENCHIAGAAVGIYILAHASLGGNVSTLIKTTSFGPTITTSGICNPAFNTTILSCSFEDIPHAVSVNSTNSAQTMVGFTFNGCWCGDADAFYADAWIEPGDWLFNGATFSGNLFGGVSRPDTDPQHDSIKLGSCQGVTIFANVLTTIDFTLVEGGSYPQGVVITGNQLASNNTMGAPFFRALTANSAGVVIQGNYPVNFTQGPDQLGLSGHIITWPILRIQPIVVGAINVTPVLDGTIFQGSNDTSGRVTLTVSSLGTSSGIQATITFAQTYDAVVGHNPHIFLMPENGPTAAINTDIYAVPTGGTGFTINSINGLTPGTYVWSYWVIQ